MVQEYQSPVRVHKYPFEMVMAAYERRFPNCPQIPVVIECVITEDSWSADDSQRQTTRRCQLNVEAPYLLKKMIGVDYIYFIQKNTLDLKGRVLEIEATNETFAARVGVVEKCKYYVHPENSEWTCFEQSALLDVKNFFGLENTVEKIAMKQYAANIAKGKELIESFMQEVNADGVMDLRPWQEEDPSYNRELRRIVSRGTEPLSPRAAPDHRRHSQPGTSKRRSCILSKSSHNMLMSPDQAVEPQTSFSTPPKLGSERSGSDQTHRRKNESKKNNSHHKSEDRLELNPKELKSSVLKQLASKVHLRKPDKKMKEDKKVLSDSFTNSTGSVAKESPTASAVVNRPCTCPVSVADILVRWDGIMVLVMCALVLVLALSAPLTFIFNRRRY